ncbi:hypothetical protein F5X96DRAFT_415226 [Biscogniauxia mediterranea]|nr:hypothetical protein F5X96DRAFT_415226 [Biscogniauxia mediterranea]
MLTQAVCRTSPRVGSLQANATAHNILCPSAASSLSTRHRHRHQQQTRAYRFGLWSSYLDPEVFRELRRRQRSIRNKYADNINHKSPWDKEPAAHESEACSSHRHGQNESASRARHVWDRRGAPDQGSHMSSTDPFWSNYDSWRSQVDQVVDRWTKEASEGIDRMNNSAGSRENVHPTTKPESHASFQTSEPTSDEGYVIDPITNRKVPKQSDDYIRARATHRPPFTPVYTPNTPNFTIPLSSTSAEERKPVYSDGGPPAAELNKYEQVELDEWTPEGHASDLRSVKATRSSSEPGVWTEEYALNHLPPEESPQETYEDIKKYKHIKYDEADIYSAESKPKHNESLTEQDALRQKELDQYGPYRYREDVSAEEPATQYEDLENYRSYNYEETKPLDDTSPKYDDLDKYRPTEFKDNAEEDKPFQQYGDLERYQTFRYQELDKPAALKRDIVAESLKEYDVKEHETDSHHATESPNATSSELHRSIDGHDEGVVVSEPEPDSTSLSMPWGNSWDDPKDESRKELEQFMAKNNEASDALDREAFASIRKARGENMSAYHYPEEDKQVDANDHTRAYPDEISGSWDVNSFPERNVAVDPSGSAYEQEIQAEVQEAEKSYADELTNTINSSRIEPALDRWESQAVSSPTNSGSEEATPDPYSQEPQGLQTSFADECGEKTMPVYATQYGESDHKDLEPASVETEPVSDPFVSSEASYDRDPEIDGFPRTSASEPATRQESFQDNGPTVYKILAYDPTMQSINIAETTSVVPDQASPLTPTEVLLRLSNPTKFFPHFAPLQAEGFEIVSGGGDVLVFRKVRPGQSNAKDQDKDATAVNPIDMMGKPSGLLNAAEFASPTGFVNYNMPQVEGETQGSASSRFRSNIDVRREEPVFSGTKPATSEEAPKKKKKRGTVKRMVFAGTWVAGLSYAIGVVSEYFATGGADGRGPSGF